jgi:CheY-like chemotaxis protein
MRVLAAEDNKTNRLVFYKMVQALDIELTFAGNGREAVALFQSLAPDIVFMDISMPEMDGKEATRAIREIEAREGGHVPIVAMTAHAMNGDDTEILAAGLDHYLTKPLKRAAIVAQITTATPPGLRPPEGAPTQAVG